MGQYSSADATSLPVHGDKREGKRFRVVEIFGPTYQGEGALAGSMSHFIRFGGCDFRCSWCDTPEAVDPQLVASNAKSLTNEEIVQAVEALPVKAPWVTLTGGNPVLFDLSLLVRRLQELDYQVAVETQGSVYKPWLDKVDFLTISPKAPSSGMVFNDEVLNTIVASRILTNPMDETCLKIPVANAADLVFADGIAGKYPMLSMYLQPVWNVELDDPLFPDNASANHVANLGYLAEVLLKGEYEHLIEAIVLPQLHKLMNVK